VTEGGRRDANAPDAQASAVLGYELVRQGRLEAAEEHLVAAEAGGILEVAFELGHLYEDLGRPSEAALAYERAVAAGDREARVNLANLLADELDRPAEAEALYREAIADGDGDALVNLGLLLCELERYGEADDALLQADAAGVDNALELLADALVERDDLIGAIAAYERARGKGQLALDPHAALVRRLEHLERRDTAESVLRDAAAEQPELLVTLGALLARAGRLRDAEQILEDAAHRQLAGAHLQHGHLLRDQGRLDEARRAYAAAVDRGDERGHLEIALMLAGQGRDDEAGAAFSAAVDAGDPGAALEVGMFEQARGRPQAAVHLLTGIATRDPLARKVLADAQEALGRYEAAEVNYRVAARAHVEDAALNLGIMLDEKLGRPGHAEVAFRQAITEGSSEARFNLGLALEHLGRDAEAAREYRTLLEEGDGRAHENLVALLHRLGRSDEAIEHERMGPRR
jgi:tetratricopeptide (TPR) repeat protein